MNIKAIAVVCGLIGGCFSGCVSGGNLASRNSMSLIYERCLEIENRFPQGVEVGIPESSLMTQVISEGNKFWEDYERLQSQVGKEKASIVLQSLVENRDFSGALMAWKGRPLLSEEELLALAYKSRGPTNLLGTFVGRPINEERFKKMRSAGSPIYIW